MNRGSSPADRTSRSGSRPGSATAPCASSRTGRLVAALRPSGHTGCHSRSHGRAAHRRRGRVPRPGLGPRPEHARGVARRDRRGVPDVGRPRRRGPPAPREGTGGGRTTLRVDRCPVRARRRDRADRQHPRLTFQRVDHRAGAATAARAAGAGRRRRAPPRRPRTRGAVHGDRPHRTRRARHAVPAPPPAPPPRHGRARPHRYTPSTTHHVVPLRPDLGVPAGSRPDAAVLHDPRLRGRLRGLHGGARGTARVPRRALGSVGRGGRGGLPRCGPPPRRPRRRRPRPHGRPWRQRRRHDGAQRAGGG